MNFFEERLEKKIPELKAMSIQQRSSDIVEFDFCMKLEEHHRFPRIEKAYSKIKKYCLDNYLDIFPFINQQNNCWMDDGIVPCYANWAKECKKITKLYSKWYEENFFIPSLFVTRVRNNKEIITHKIKLRLLPKGHLIPGDFHFLCKAVNVDRIRFTASDYDEGDRIKLYAVINNMVFETGIYIDVYSKECMYIIDKDFKTISRMINNPLLTSLSFKVDGYDFYDSDMFNFHEIDISHKNNIIEI